MGAHSSREQAFFASIFPITLKGHGEKYFIAVNVHGIIPKLFLPFAFPCLSNLKKGFGGCIAFAHYSRWVVNFLFVLFLFSLLSPGLLQNSKTLSLNFVFTGPQKSEIEANIASSSTKVRTHSFSPIYFNSPTVYASFSPPFPFRAEHIALS